MGKTLIRGIKMEIKVLKRTSNELKIEIVGEGHTFCNVLQKALLEDDATEMAGYNLPHPLMSDPTIYIQTKKGLKPETAIRNAVKKIRKQNKEFKATFEKALKEWQRKLSSTASAKLTESSNAS
jgi:DNA-directed RNA polymerase subunit L